MTYLQYDIVIVNLAPTVGGKIKKICPCVIVSPNEMNRHLATVVVCPITSQSKNYPTRISFDLDGQVNWIVIDQVLTIDKSRITKITGHLDNKTIGHIKGVLKETYVD